jgi:hypothetical protein
LQKIILCALRSLALNPVTSVLNLLSSIWESRLPDLGPVEIASLALVTKRDQTSPDLLARPSHDSIEKL